MENPAAEDSVRSLMIQQTRLWCFACFLTRTQYELVYDNAKFDFVL